MLRLTITVLCLLLAQSALAGGFVPVSLAPEHGISALNRSVTMEILDRELMGASYGSVTIGNVDIYDRFPYLEAHYFQVLSDPKWHRLVFGESDAGMDAYDGSGTPFGPLDSPHGLAADAGGRVFVADTGNDRVLVLQSSSEFDQLTLTPLFEIPGLLQPYDVAISDRGTPTDLSDDVLYVANSGGNEVQRWVLHENGAEFSDAIGELGSGDLHFAGPMAISVGRVDGRNDDRIFVADAHNQRFVRLIDDGDGLRWDASLPHDLGTITSLDTDHYGNVYAAAPQSGQLAKFTPELMPVAQMGDLNRPRSFHVPMVTVHDHVRGEVQRQGHGGGLLLEEWSDHSGLRLLDFDVEVSDLQVAAEDAIEIGFLLNDRAQVSAEIRGPGSPQVLARADLGVFDAGQRQLTLPDEALLEDMPAGSYELEITAISTYESGRQHRAVESFSTSGSRSATPANRLILGQASPNPFNPSTTLQWSFPISGQDYELAVYDARGRLVRTLERGVSVAGSHSTVWNGLDEGGRSVASGVYHARLSLGEETLSRPMVLVK